MMPVLPPTFDQVRARANLISSLSSYSYVDNFYFLLGWKSRHAALTDAQKQYFYARYPIFLVLENVFKRIRMVASFLMFVASMLLSLPMAGIALGVFAFSAPYLMPLLVISAILAGVTFLMSTTIFVVQEKVLDDTNVKVMLENIEVLTKDYESNKEKINEAMKRLDVFLQYSRHHNGDKGVRRVLKDLKAFLAYEEKSFMYEAHVRLLLYTIVEQVEADNKTLSEDMQQLLRTFNSESLSRLTMDFYSASILIPELIDDVHQLLDVVQSNVVLQDNKKYEEMARQLQDLSEKQKLISVKLLNSADGRYTALQHLKEYYAIIHNANGSLAVLDETKVKQAGKKKGVAFGKADKKPLGASNLCDHRLRSRSLDVSHSGTAPLRRCKSELLGNKNNYRQ